MHPIQKEWVKYTERIGETSNPMRCTRVDLEKLCDSIRRDTSSNMYSESLLNMIQEYIDKKKAIRSI